MASRLRTPLIAINFKSYLSASGKNALKLARICDGVAKAQQASILVCVEALDLEAIAAKVEIPVFAEHVDPVDPGAKTGKIVPLEAKDAGARGTLLDHSEDRIPLKTIAASIEKCKAVGLTTIVCADTLAKAKAVARLRPDFVAYEPPELIGGDVSVTTRPQAITRVVAAVRSVNRSVGILVGAGVKTAQDVRIARKLKTQGVLLASGVAANENPKKALLGLCAGLR